MIIVLTSAGVVRRRHEPSQCGHAAARGDERRAEVARPRATRGKLRRASVLPRAARLCVVGGEGFRVVSSGLRV